MQRVKLTDPLRGTMENNRVFIVDVSLRGLRIAHQEAIGDKGSVVTLRATWDAKPIELKCEIVRTQIHRVAQSAMQKTLYHSGVEIRQVVGLSAITLRELIEAHVVRALDEQKANANGIPATAAQHFQTGNATHFKRHELFGGRWRETATADPTQPPNGFTVSAEHSPEEVAMLRSAFEQGDAASGGRELIWRLAKLSISSRDGVPTRRFMP